MASMLAALTKPSVTNEPPSESDLRRNDIAILVTVIFALFLGWGIGNNVLTAGQEVELGQGLPAVTVPARWIKGQGEGYVVRAYNPRSPSTFDTEVKANVRPLGPGENLVTARSGLSVQRSQQLLRYRELSAEQVTVNGEPGMLVTYAYVADPSREAGALAEPVVVSAQDLLFVEDGRLVVVTVAADAANLDAEERYFRIVHDSLNVEFVEENEQ